VYPEPLPVLCRRQTQINLLSAACEGDGNEIALAVVMAVRADRVNLVFAIWAAQVAPASRATRAVGSDAHYLVDPHTQLALHTNQPIIDSQDEVAPTTLGDGLPDTESELHRFQRERQLGYRTLLTWS
jgi:hypothetical protein